MFRSLAPLSGRVAPALALALAVILSAGLALASYLDFANFKRAHTQLVTSRMLVPAQDLRHLIESSMDFGLGISQLTVLPERLRGMVEVDPDLISVMVYGHDGRLIFHSEQNSDQVPDPIPASWARPADVDAEWHLTKPDRYLLGTSFENSFGQEVGTLLLAYDRARVDGPVASMGAALTRNLLLTLSAMILVVIVGANLLARPMRRELDAAKALASSRSYLAADEPVVESQEAITRPEGANGLFSKVTTFVLSAEGLHRRIARAAGGDAAAADDMAQGEAAAQARMGALGRFDRRMLVFGLSAILLGIVIISNVTMVDFRREFEPALHRKAETLGDSMGRMLASLDLRGVPPQFLHGLDGYFELIRSGNPEVGYLTLVDPEGQVLASAGEVPTQVSKEFRAQARDPSPGPSTQPYQTHFDTLIPVRRDQAVIGYIHVGQQRSFIDHQVHEVWWDLGTVALVSMLIAFELLLFGIAFFVHIPQSAIGRLASAVAAGDFAARIGVRYRNEFGELASALDAGLNRLSAVCRAALSCAPSESARAALTQLRDRFWKGSLDATHAVGEDRLILIRWPFFLLIFADSLSLSFFPLYVQHIYTPVEGLSRELMLGLPISVFMLVWALSLPAAGAWSDRIGRRRAFVIGAGVAALGLALTATAQGIWDLILWRSLTAVGYGLVFITAQGYVVDYTPASQRTRGMAMFLAAFFGGSLCGAAIGGILAERIGYSPVFWLAAGLALVSALVAWRFLAAPVGSVAAARPRMRLQDLMALMRDPRFLSVTFLTAVPSKLILTGFLYYAMPLYLSSLALNAGDVGRVIMTYGLAIILLSPLVGHLADVWGKRAVFVGVGALLAALAILLVELKTSALLAVLGVSLLGAAHAVGVSPQLALVMDVSSSHSQRMGAGTVMGIFRLLERIGNVLGPIVLAVLIGAFGFDGAFLALGLYSLLSVALFGLVWAFFSRKDRPARTSRLLQPASALALSAKGAAS